MTLMQVFMLCTWWIEPARNATTSQAVWRFAFLLPKTINVMYDYGVARIKVCQFFISWCRYFVCWFCFLSWTFVPRNSDDVGSERCILILMRTVCSIPSGFIISIFFLNQFSILLFWLYLSVSWNFQKMIEYHAKGFLNLGLYDVSRRIIIEKVETLMQISEGRGQVHVSSKILQR